MLRWVAEGKSNWQIGQIAHCAVGTVKKHLQHIYRKLGVESRTAAAAVYLRANHLLEVQQLRLRASPIATQGWARSTVKGAPAAGTP